jgi:hypothetical protein
LAARREGNSQSVGSPDFQRRTDNPESREAEGGEPIGFPLSIFRARRVPRFWASQEQFETRDILLDAIDKIKIPSNTFTSVLLMQSTMVGASQIANRISNRFTFIFEAGASLEEVVLMLREAHRSRPLFIEVSQEKRLFAEFVRLFGEILQPQGAWTSALDSGFASTMKF